MSLQERIYSVLLVSSSDSINSALVAMLPESTYDPVHTVTSVSAARRAFADRAFDYVIVNSPLPDDSGTRFAIDACASRGTVVLLLVKGDVCSEIHDRVAEHGVFTLAKPVSRSTFATALGWMASARERLRSFEKRTLTIEEKMEEIRIVNRAKWLLISRLDMDEPEAHRYLEKQAMDRCATKREVAEEILKTYS